MDEILNLASEPLLIKNICNSEHANKEVLDEIVKLSLSYDTIEFKKNNNNNNSISVSKKILDDFEFSNLKSYIEKECKDFVKITNDLDFEDIQVTKSWVNNTLKGESHHIHVHPMSVVSGIIFLDSNPENNKLNFRTSAGYVPYSDLTPLMRTKTFSLSQIDSEVYVNNFQFYIVLFFSHLEHSVETVTEEMPRRTLSFNTWWKGQVGHISTIEAIDFT